MTFFSKSIRRFSSLHFSLLMVTLNSHFFPSLACWSNMRIVCLADRVTRQHARHSSNPVIRQRMNRCRRSSRKFMCKNSKLYWMWGWGVVTAAMRRWPVQATGTLINSLRHFSTPINPEMMKHRVTLDLSGSDRLRVCFYFNPKDKANYI